ncbi:hypothetical protein K3495_g16297 [Podosphaera aphanis]|nr:hypothetical protein K3495_g16297 [Podosphaera aphanis]
MPRGNFNHGPHNGFGWAQAVQGNWRGSSSQREGFNRGGFNPRGYQGFQPPRRGGFAGPRSNPSQNGAGHLRAMDTDSEWQGDGDKTPHHSNPQSEYSSPHPSGYTYDALGQPENF